MSTNIITVTRTVALTFTRSMNPGPIRPDTSCPQRFRLATAPRSSTANTAAMSRNRSTNQSRPTKNTSKPEPKPKRITAAWKPKPTFFGKSVLNIAAPSQSTNPTIAVRRKTANVSNAINRSDPVAGPRREKAYRTDPPADGTSPRHTRMTYLEPATEASHTTQT